ncbi:aspartyl protease family protein [Hibiscus syriacus]|uniref:Aspartyl protease family protein n=1 Tax=Hibiscus syriacus TaxID=106335 RepID=A0A6A2WXY2_HIBSY|nr:aspartyl protease family protein [Hibiscus syriacus]
MPEPFLTSPKRFTILLQPFRKRRCHLLNLSITSRASLMSTRGFLDALSHALGNSPSPSAVQACAATLHSLLIAEESYRPIIGSKRDILYSLLSIITANNAPPRSIKDALKALFGIALYPLNRASLLGLGAVPALVALIVRDARTGIVEDATAVLAQIAGCEESEEAIRRVGGIRVLGDLLDEGTGASERIRENAVAALLNLARCGGEKGRKEVRDMCAKVIEGITDLTKNGSAKGKTKAVELLKIIVDGDVNARELMDVHYKPGSTLVATLERLHSNIFRVSPNTCNPSLVELNKSKSVPGKHPVLIFVHPRIEETAKTARLANDTLNRFLKEDAASARLIEFLLNSLLRTYTSVVVTCNSTNSHEPDCLWSGKGAYVFGCDAELSCTGRHQHDPYGSIVQSEVFLKEPPRRGTTKPDPTLFSLGVFLAERFQRIFLFDLKSKPKISFGLTYLFDLVPSHLALGNEAKYSFGFGLRDEVEFILGFLSVSETLELPWLMPAKQGIRTGTWFSARKGTTRLDVEGNLKTQNFVVPKKGFEYQKSILLIVNVLIRQSQEQDGAIIMLDLHINLYNALQRGKAKEIVDGDVNALIAYFDYKKHDDPGFFMTYSVDESGALYNLIWSDSTSRSDYTCFGDVIAFDTTYKDNLYGRPIMPINFLEAMMNKSPISVVTDGDRAMQRAIKSVIPYAKHRLCSWHLSRNAQANIGDPKFTATFSKCMASWWTTKEFDIQWRSIISEFTSKSIHGSDAMARFAALRSTSSRLCYIASKTDESFKTARDEMKKTNRRIRKLVWFDHSVNQSIVVNNVRDPQRKQRKRKEVPKNKVEKKIRRCGYCNGEGHNKLTCSSSQAQFEYKPQPTSTDFSKTDEMTTISI